MQGQTEYSLERIIELPNFKARIFRPVLTELEKSKRMKNIQKASANLIETKEQKNEYNTNYTNNN